MKGGTAMKKKYIPARMEKISFGRDDIVTTSFALDLDMPGVELPDVDLTGGTVKTIKAIEAQKSISQIQ